MWKLWHWETFPVLLAIAGIVGIRYVLYLDKQNKVEWSPCGNTNLTTTYRTHDGGRMFRYFDDGKRLWRIRDIKPPTSDGAPPIVEIVLEFERSPQNCIIWKMEHGIKD